MNYFDHPAMNHSSLKKFADSPLHFRHYIDEPQPDKAVFAFGRLVHCLTLEPEKFEDDFALFTGKTRRGKAFDEFELEAEGRTIVLPGEHRTALAMATAVNENEVVRKIYASGERICEQEIFWSRDGLECKAKLDLVIPGAGVFDLKTTANIRPHKFASDAFSYAYISQMAWYADAWHAHTGEVLDASIIAVQKEAPHDVIVFDYAEEHLEYGRRLIDGWLDDYRQCQERDDWPGMARGERLTLGWPGWVPKPENEAEGGYDWGRTA